MFYLDLSIQLSIAALLGAPGPVLVAPVAGGARLGPAPVPLVDGPGLNNCVLIDS